MTQALGWFRNLGGNAPRSWLWRQIGVKLVKAAQSLILTELNGSWGFKCTLTICSSTPWIQAWPLSRWKEDACRKARFPFPRSILSCWRRGQNCQSWSTLRVPTVCVDFWRLWNGNDAFCSLITQLTNFTADKYRKRLRFCNTAGLFLPFQGQQVWDSRRNQQRVETVSVCISRCLLSFFFVFPLLSHINSKFKCYAQRQKLPWEQEG